MSGAASMVGNTKDIHTKLSAAIGVVSNHQLAIQTHGEDLRKSVRLAQMPVSLPYNTIGFYVKFWAINFVFKYLIGSRLTDQNFVIALTCAIIFEAYNRYP